MKSQIMVLNKGWILKVTFVIALLATLGSLFLGEVLKFPPGWLKVDTLQHNDYPEIYGVGDVTGIPNSKTGAAIRKQALVVAQNISDAIAGLVPSMKYYGYASCPLITGFGKVILGRM